MGTLPSLEHTAYHERGGAYHERGGAYLERGGVPWSAAVTVITKESQELRADVDVMAPVNALMEKPACCQTVNEGGVWFVREVCGLCEVGMKFLTPHHIFPCTLALFKAHQSIPQVRPLRLCCR